jgi:hypothetical protein
MAPPARSRPARQFRRQEHRRLPIRTWGRLNGIWTEVTTDANGYNDEVYTVTLIQCLLLNLGEDPFFSSYGIPAQPSVLTQIFPDYYTYQTQQKFSQFFVNLTVQKVRSPTPTYNITVVTHAGAVITASIPV